jgi:hypothetical protein
MKRKLLIICFLFIFLLGTVSAGVYFFWGMEKQKAALENTIASYLHRPVKIHAAHLQIIPRVQLVLEEVTIEEQNRYGGFVSLQELRLGLSVPHLFFGTFYFYYLTLDHPTFTFIREEAGRWNCTDLVHTLSAPRQEPGPLTKNLRFVLQRVAIHQGAVEFRDISVSSAQVIALEGVELATSINPGQAATSFSFQCRVRGGTKGTRLQGKGSLDLISKGTPSQALKVKGNLAVSNLEVARIAPYLQGIIPLVAGPGLISGKFSLEGVWGGRIESSATVELLDCALQGAGGKEEGLKISKAALKFQATKEGDTLLVPSIELTLPEGTVVAKASVVRGANPWLEVSGTAKNLSYRKCAVYLPLAFSDPSAQDFLVRRVLDGNIETLSFRYSGASPGSTPAPENTQRPDLELAGKFSDFSVQAADNLPPFRQLGGAFNFLNGELEVTGLTGFLGNSQIEPSTVSLSRSRFLDVSARVALDLEEVNRVLHSPLLPPDAQGYLEKLRSLAGTGVLSLDCSGPLSDPASITFAGNLQLQNAAVDYRNFFQVASQVNGTIAFTPYLIEFKDITGLWAASPFTCNGAIESYRNRQSQLNIHVESTQADINDIISAFFPWKDTYGQGEGTTSMDFICQGYRTENFRYAGQARFQGLSLTFSAFPNPFTELSGEVGFAPEGLTFRNMRLRSGSSDVLFSAKVVGYHAPRISGQGTGSFIDLSDFYTFPKPGEGGEPARYIVENFSLAVDQGRYQDLQIKGLKTTGSLQHGILSLFGASAREGSYGTFSFTNLRTGIDQTAPAPIVYQEGVATAPLLVFDSYEGTWIGRDIKLPLSSGNDAEFFLLAELGGVSVEKLLEGYPPEKRKLTGTLTLEGKLSGRGKNPAECFKASKGSTSFTIKNGVLRKGQILSKLFSLLNVSRIFSQDYGNLLTSGMAYDLIQGDFAIDQGKAKINLLSFDSPAMKMNTVGDIDFGNKTLDMEIAVQPLETIDKVVGNIPILGTVLMGEQGAIVITYYTVTGPFADPKIDQVVFQSLGRKGQGIFRRIFKLPMDLLRPNNKKESGTTSNEGKNGAPAPEGK